jgi:hypothetical protein
MSEFLRQVRATWKLCLSFFKRDWDLRDYPISITHHDVSAAISSSRFRHDAIAASIINWGVFGGGATVTEAIAALETSFANAKAERQRSGESLPRPGTHVPVRFASRERVEKHAELENDFTYRVLKLPWAFISDESSLWDFHGQETNDELVQRIREEYGVDVSDNPDASIAEILERIAAARARSKA